MSQNTEKKYNRAERTGVSEPENAVQPRRKRRVLAEPEDFWGRLRLRAGKKRRWFGRRCRRVIREAKANRFPESNRGALQALLMLWGLLPAAASRLRERLLGKRKERIHRSGKFGTWFEKASASSLPSPSRSTICTGWILLPDTGAAYSAPLS